MFSWYVGLRGKNRKRPWKASASPPSFRRTKTLLVRQWFLGWLKWQMMWLLYFLLQIPIHGNVIWWWCRVGLGNRSVRTRSSSFERSEMSNSNVSSSCSQSSRLRCSPAFMFLQSPTGNSHSKSSRANIQVERCDGYRSHEWIESRGEQRHWHVGDVLFGSIHASVASRIKAKQRRNCSISNSTTSDWSQSIIHSTRTWKTVNHPFLFHRNPFTSFFFSLQTRISTRLQELEHMPAHMSAELRNGALIELKSLKLLQLQKQLRNELLQTMKVRSSSERSLILSLHLF